MYLFPSECFALPLAHTALSRAAKPIERRAGFCEGIGGAAPLAALGLTQHCAASPQFDGQRTIAADLVVVDTDSLSPEAAIADEPGVRWSLQIDAARLAWSRLTEDDLRSSQGVLHKLVALIQERYTISHEDALRRVQHFLDKQQS